MDKITTACKVARLRLGWSQEQAAEEMGRKHVNTIKRWERGIGSFGTVCAYLYVLDVPEAEILALVKEAGGAQ